MPRFMDDELKELLERLHDKYNRPEFIEDDPISVPHRYTDRADREIAGFLAATIAWGNRRAIVTSGHRMMRCMDDAPADFVRNASDRELATLETYVHRTFNGRDLRDFVLALRRMDRRFGGLGAFFEERYAAAQSIPAVLSEFRREFFSCDHALRCEKHLSSIDRGAACKRLCMFLRWMVRRDERGVDFGQWTRIPMSALYIPLDLHTGDMATMDTDGTLYIRGRSKTMILSGNGQNIYPEEIEDKLNNMYLVLESLILETENGKLKALVVPDYEQAELEGVDKNDLPQIMQNNLTELNTLLAAYERVSELAIYPTEFEKTPKRSIKRYLYSPSLLTK